MPKLSGIIDRIKVAIRGLPNFAVCLIAIVVLFSMVTALQLHDDSSYVLLQECLTQHDEMR